MGREIQDRAIFYNTMLSVLAGLTAFTTFAISLTAGGWNTAMRVLALILALATVVMGVRKFSNERAFKKQQEGERTSLDQALKAESRRTSLLINGAMLGTAEKLRHFSVLDQEAKKAEISGFRASIVSKVCDLMQSEAPRAAYFRVQDLVARPQRVMRSGSYVDSRNREDSFTSEFREGQDADQSVWELIDRGDVELSNNTNEKVPASWD